MPSGKKGGPRMGAGRPPKLAESVRRNRVVVMLTDAEFEQLQRMAEDGGLPVGTTLYCLIAGALEARSAG